LLGTIPSKQQFLDALPIPAPLLDLVEVAPVGVKGNGDSDLINVRFGAP